MPFQKGNTYGLGNTYRKGKKNSEETRKKISNALKGKIPKNLSQINANKKGSGNPMFGKHLSEQSKIILSRSLKESYFKRRNHENTWSDEDKEINYQNFHRKIRKLFGEPDTCEYCNKSGLVSCQIHWASKNHVYSEKREDWLRLCAKCHKEYDYKYVQTT